MTTIVVGVTTHVTAQAFLRPQLLAMTARGWEVHLVASWVPSDSPLRSLSGVTIHEITMNRRFSPLADLRAEIRWKRLLRMIRPDLLLVSTPKASFLGLLAGRSEGVSSRVYHVRGLRLEGLKGPVAWMSRWAERVSLSTATSVVCDSDSLLGELHVRSLLAQNKGTVLGSGSACGVETSLFTPAPEMSAGDAVHHSAGLTIGFTGRICADKGVPELIQAVAQIRESGVNATLMLVGDVEEASVLEPWLRRPEESEWLRVEGWRDDLPAVMRTMDIFCLPSHREGMPIAILEAMATGLPVVTTDATGCRDLIRDGLNGFTVPIGDADAIARSLDILAADADLRIRMGNSGRALVQRDFESSRVDARFVDFLASQVRLTSDDAGKEGSADA